MTTAALLAVLGALLLGAMSPGPSFVVVVRTAVGGSRRAGLATALGMGAGGVVFSVLALVGLYAVLEAVPWVYAGLQVAGGAYLLLLAVRIWRSAGVPPGTGPQIPDRTRAFRLGLTTQLSNPKTAVVYGSIFAALLPHDRPLWVTLAVPPLVFAVEAGWYSLVALGFSRPRPRAAYARVQGVIDRVAAAVIGALGLRLLSEVPRTVRLSLIHI